MCNNVNLDIVVSTFEGVDLSILAYRLEFASSYDPVVEGAVELGREFGGLLGSVIGSCADANADIALLTWEGRDTPIPGANPRESIRASKDEFVLTYVCERVVKSTSAEGKWSVVPVSYLAGVGLAASAGANVAITLLLCE